ncbi:GNAT family N-acetyltransferase [Streptomyces sp. NPDC006463]|uniref:GNAT family N-acetyltransferase n=1 Tax=Streptomyces sp. NPDC006463 TaxID=3364746 RepID=UPI0036AAEF16
MDDTWDTSDPPASRSLLTERLVLRPLDADGARRLIDGAPGPDDHWGPGYPDAGDRAGAQRYLRVLAAHGDPLPFGAYEIRRRDDGTTIGGAGFHGPADARGRVTVGYGLIRSARGRGYATEALRALLDHARKHGATAVLGDTDLENTASQRVMEAVGMRLLREDGRLRYYAAESS